MRPKTFLITGVAGSGKSTLEREFARRGYQTIEIDDGYAEWRHRDTDEVLEYLPDEPEWHEVALWRIKEEKLKQCLADMVGPVFVFGSAAKISQIMSLFDKVFLLEYHAEALVRERIAGRVDGYGAHPDELTKILSYVEPYQASVRRRGAVCIDTALSVNEKVDRILGACI